MKAPKSLSAHREEVYVHTQKEQEVGDGDR
ncbi:hypothetical protein [Microbulbifer okhotskensis]